MHLADAEELGGLGDVFLLGGYPSDTTRHPNASAAIAVAWSRAMTLGQMAALALSPWDVAEPLRAVIPFELGAAPPPSNNNNLLLLGVGD